MVCFSVFTCCGFALVGEWKHGRLLEKKELLALYLTWIADQANGKKTKKASSIYPI